MDKKIGRRYGRRVRIATIVCARKHTVTPGTVCPSAIYVVYTIYNPTNNGVYIEYRNKIHNTISTTIFAIQPSQNIPRQFSLFAAIHLFARSVTKSNISTCAQPCEKEIYDFVFEHGKGTSPAKKPGRRYRRRLFNSIFYCTYSCIYSYSGRRNVITPLQILSSYT